VVRSFVAEQRFVSGNNAVYKPVLAVTVALGLAIFVTRLMIASGAADDGLMLMRQGRIDQAIGYFERAVRLDPFDPQVRLFLAEAYETKGVQTQQGNYFGKAKDQYLAAHKNNRYNPRFAHTLGGYLVRMGFFDQGLDYLQRTIDLHPLFAGHYRNYGNAAVSVSFFFLKENDMANVQKYADRVFAMDRKVQERFGDPTALAFAVGQTHFLLNDADQAKIYLERALNVGEDKPHALMLLSLVYEQQGNSVRARELYDQAIGLDPASERTYQAFKNIRG
jgi:tetratricopeptide (TPR) repeat protein